MIAIDSLSKKYGIKQVLCDINLSIGDGEVCGIMGDNGAGKTTLFRCIAGLEDYKGTIVSDFGTLKNHLGLLLTEPFFFSKITGREYIQLLCNARGKSPGDMDERNIFELPLNQYAATYSTGMKKKLALTAILLQENKCYVLDEPFNGVDVQGNIMIVEIIRRLKELGKTVLLSSHIFSTLNHTCDKIHVLNEGRLTQTVERADFRLFEEELTQMTIGKKLDKLALK